MCKNKRGLFLPTSSPDTVGSLCPIYTVSFTFNTLFTTISFFFFFFFFFFFLSILVNSIYSAVHFFRSCIDIDVYCFFFTTSCNSFNISVSTFFFLTHVKQF